MQTILLSCTTEIEANHIRHRLNQIFKINGPNSWMSDKYSIFIDITGAGIPFVMFNLQRSLHILRPSYLIHFGIAGINKGHGHIGDIVEVTRDQFGDIGVYEKDESFINMFDIGLWDRDLFPFEDGFLVNRSPLDITGVPMMEGLTVNSVPGSLRQQKVLSDRMPYQVETMEGAAVFMVALLNKIPFCALRGISNYVEPRDRASWDLKTPLIRLAALISDLLHDENRLIL